jgi:hypothetical protein
LECSAFMYQPQMRFHIITPSGSASMRKEQ